MKTISVLIALLVASSVAFAADELDHDQLAHAPQGVVVRVQNSTHEVEIFKASQIDRSIVGNPAATVAAIEKTAKPENLLTQFRPVDLRKNSSELDRDSSTSAWCYYYWGSYWTPYTYFAYYTPYTAYMYSWAYNYTWAGYNWYWYWY